MPTNLEPVDRFIQYFELTNKDKSVCFQARIEFQNPFEGVQLNSEVHVVNMKRYGEIYLYILESEAFSNSIPGAIHLTTTNTHFRDGKCLEIGEEDSLWGNYLMRIYPTGKLCFGKEAAEQQPAM